MALFGNNGFFDTMFTSFKENPLENAMTLGAYGVVKASVKPLTKWSVEAGQDIGGEFIKGINAAGSLVGQSDPIQSELSVKSELRADNQLSRARQARARSASLFSSQSSAPSLLG